MAIKLALAGTQINRTYLGTTQINDVELPSPFIEATGGTVTTSGNYKIHTFTTTGSSDFTITYGGLTNYNAVEILVVGGGGGGGAQGGGGGGGGLIYIPANANVTMSAQNYTITVGAGGGINSSPQDRGENGANSTISGTGFTLTALGGGGGGSSATNAAGKDGGSGGGAGNNNNSGLATGLGLQPSQSGLSGTYGFGLSGSVYINNSFPGGGGGGAGTSPITGPGQWNGGNGKAVSISGASVTYAGGGGGCDKCAGGDISPAGGTGGGGAGGRCASTGSNGTNGLGGGGGGSGAGNGIAGRGGSGVVIIRYQYQE